MKTLIDQDVCIDSLWEGLDDSSDKCSEGYISPDKYLLMINNVVSNGCGEGFSE